MNKVTIYETINENEEFEDNLKFKLFKLKYFSKNHTQLNLVNKTLNNHLVKLTVEQNNYKLSIKENE